LGATELPEVLQELNVVKIRVRLLVPLLEFNLYEKQGTGLRPPANRSRLEAMRAQDTQSARRKSHARDPRLAISNEFFAA